MRLIQFLKNDERNPSPLPLLIRKMKHFYDLRNVKSGSGAYLTRSSKFHLLSVVYCQYLLKIKDAFGLRRSTEKDFDLIQMHSTAHNGIPQSEFVECLFCRGVHEEMKDLIDYTLDEGGESPQHKWK